MASRNIKVRPGKGQSKLVFFVGIAFVITGLFVAIPMFGPIGILWIGMAGLICYTHFKNAYTDDGMPMYEISIDEKEDINVRNIESRLKKLEQLFDSGLITREEYDDKRKEIISKI